MNYTHNKSSSHKKQQWLSFDTYAFKNDPNHQSNNLNYNNQIFPFLVFISKTQNLLSTKFSWKSLDIKECFQERTRNQNKKIEGVFYNTFNDRKNDIHQRIANYKLYSPSKKQGTDILNNWTNKIG